MVPRGPLVLLNSGSLFIRMTQIGSIQKTSANGGSQPAPVTGTLASALGCEPHLVFGPFLGRGAGSGMARVLGALGSWAWLPCTHYLLEVPLLPATWKGARPHRAFAWEQGISLLNIAGPRAS